MDLQSLHGPINDVDIQEGAHENSMTQSPSKLCSYCRDLIDWWAKSTRNPFYSTDKGWMAGGVYDHCESIFALKESSEAGCALCTTFIRGFYSSPHSFEVELDQIGGMLDLYAERNMFSEVAIRKDQLEVAFNTYVPSFGNITQSRCGVYILPANFQPSSSDINLESRSSNTGVALPLLKAWLKNCTETHHICRSAREQAVPTRLLFLGDSKVRLCLSAKHPDSTTYATLSHCWGSGRFDTLTKANLKIYLRGVPETALSKTFRDAILVSREMGIDYLWIESLCIIQDDDSDWRKESALMSSVYGGSALNIAASGAANGTIGCFFDRTPDWKCQVRTASKHYECVPMYLYPQSLAAMPLLRRSWALQERLLPTRTVHFTSTQIFWECRETIACEMFPVSIPEKLLKDIPDVLYKRTIRKAMWPWIVKQYSRCGLTNDSDKLVAISGLARTIQLQDGEHYVGGLWREDLEYQLGWRSSAIIGGKFDQSVEPSHTTYQAPSWPWASSDREVDLPALPGSLFPNTSRTVMRKDLVTEDIKVLKVETTLVGKDPFGAILDARLRLSCQMLVHGEIDQLKGFEESGSLAGHSYLQLLDAGSTDPPPAASHPTRVWVNIRSDRGRAALLGRYHFLFIAVHPSEIHSGLILEKTNLAQGEYKRSGSFFTGYTETEATTSQFTQFRETCEDPRYHARDGECVDVVHKNRGKRFIIDII